MTLISTSPRPRVPVNSIQADALKRFHSGIASGEYEFHSIPSVCGTHTTEAIHIAEYERYGLPMSTWLAPESGVMWTSPVLRDNSLAKFYREMHTSIFQSVYKYTSEYYATQIRRGITVYDWVSQSLGKEVTNWLVFDIGCSAGGMLEIFREKQNRVAGSDLGVPDKIAFGKEHGLSIELGEMDLLVKHGTADLVLLNHVVEHIPDPVSFLLGVSKHVKPNGYIYVEVPSFEGRSYNYDFQHFLMFGHVFHFTVNTLCRVGQRAGFTVVSVTRMNNAICILFQNVSSVVETWESQESERVAKVLRKQASFYRLPYSAAKRVLEGSRDLVKHLLK